MRGVWVSVLFAAAAAAFPIINTGCGGSAKELPKVVATETEKAPAAAVVVPAKSEPAAVAVVERALKVSTDGNPARVERAKVNRVKMSGSVITPARPVKTVRRVEAVWPARLAQTDEYSADSDLTTTLVRLRRPVLWIGNIKDGKASPSPIAITKELEAAVAAEMVGRHWMALLVPLTDPQTVVFAARKDTLNGKAVDVIRAAAPGTPVFSLWFDETSGLLVQVSFAHVEPGNRTETQKVFALLSHRAVDGLMLPGRIEYRQSLPVPLEEWNVESWEFPERLDDATFDEPK